MGKEAVVVRYAELNFPGIMFPEMSTVKVGPDTTAKELFKKHGKKGCYRIRFFTRTEAIIDGEKVFGNPKYEPKSYLFGVSFTLRQMKESLDAEKHSTLLWNIEVNKYDGAVKCLPGNWQPLDKDVVVIIPDEELYAAQEERRNSAKEKRQQKSAD